MNLTDLAQSFLDTIWLHVSPAANLDHAACQLAACTGTDTMVCTHSLVMAGLDESRWPMETVEAARGHGAWPATLPDREALALAVDIVRKSSRHSEIY